MLKIVNGSNGVTAQIVDNNGVVLVSYEAADAISAMDYFSHLYATIVEGYRSGIVTE